MTECVIELIQRGSTRDKDQKTEVFAERYPVGRNEFQAAGVNGYKPECQFVIWASEYAGQQELQVGNKRMTIYRTYGERPDGKIELYAAERVGNYGR